MKEGRSFRSRGGTFDAEASTSSYNKNKFWDPVRRPFDSTHPKLHKIPFDYFKGNYRKELVDELRLSIGYDVTKTEEWEEFVCVLFYDEENDKGMLDFYIDADNVYSVALGLDGFLFEFGKCPKQEQVVDEQTTTEPPGKKGRGKKNDKFFDKMNKSFAKPLKVNKNKPPEPVTETRLLGSHLLGLGDGYGGRNRLKLPSSVALVRNSLIKSIQTILSGRHVPVRGEVNPICYGWSEPLTVLTVASCESARFHPVCWAIEQIFESTVYTGLPPGLIPMLNEWKKMSRLYYVPDLSVPFGGDTFPEFEDITVASIVRLCQDEKWAVGKALALICKSSKPAYRYV